MGIRRGIPTKQVMNTLTQAIYPIGMMLLIIGAVAHSNKYSLMEALVGQLKKYLLT